MLDRKRYGLEDKWPKLAKLQQEVSDLEQRRLNAERAVMAARQAVEEGREEDDQYSAKVLRSGKDMPEPKHEMKAKARLQASERTLRAYGKALEGAQADLAAFTAQHAAEIRAGVVEALEEKARLLAQHAREAAAL
jgi:hypothetical protein